MQLDEQLNASISQVPDAHREQFNMSQLAKIYVQFVYLIILFQFTELQNFVLSFIAL